MQSSIGRSRVLGEYLRICFYGDRGDLLRLDKKVEGLSRLYETDKRDQG
jgi:hypothetical protein